MPVVSSALDPRTIPAALRARLLASVTAHIRAASSPREGVLAAAKEAKADALRNGWSTLVAHVLGEFVERLGGELIGQDVTETKRRLKAARAAENEAERFYRRAVERGDEVAAVNWRRRLAKARADVERAERDAA